MGSETVVRISMSPLYITGKTSEGILLLGGVFRLQDGHGFPLDASFEECKRTGKVIDWLEALSDCWLNSPSKFDSFLRQAELLTGSNLGERFAWNGSLVLSRFPKMITTRNPIDTVCRYVMAKKRRFSVIQK